MARGERQGMRPGRSLRQPLVSTAALALVAVALAWLVLRLSA